MYKYVKKYYVVGQRLVVLLSLLSCLSEFINTLNHNKDVNKIIQLTYSV